MDRSARFYRGRRVMVAGGLGFVGSNLARRLADLGAEVLVVDALVPGQGGNLYNVAGAERRLSIHVGDVRDGATAARLVEGCEVVFSLAGQISHIDSMRDPLADLEMNCRGPLTILEACRLRAPEAKVVYASTRQVYGRPERLPVDESHPRRPTDVNGVDKLAGETYHAVYHSAYGLRTTSLRMTNTYGPRQLMMHNRQGFLPWFIRRALDGGEIALYGDGSQLRDVTYVDDAVDAFLLAGASPAADGGVFNLGGTAPVSLREIATRIVELAGSGSVRSVPWPPEKKAIDIGSFYADYSKIRRALGWEPKVSLVDGLWRTIAYYQAHWQHYWSGVPEGSRLDTLQRPEAPALAAPN